MHLPWLRRGNFGLLAISVSLTMLSLIIPAMHAARVAHSRSVAAGPWIDHTFANDSFQVSTPANWELFPGPALSNSGIRLIDRENDLHLVASVTSKQDLAIQTLAELSQKATQSLTKVAQNLVRDEMQLTEVDGHRAADQLVAGTFDGVNLRFHFRHVEYPDAWIEVQLWTTRTRFEANEATLSKIAGSIRHGH